MADYAELKSRFDELKAEGLKLNMMRGKPETKQVALSIPMLSLITQRDDMVRNGVDAANYGELAGMPEARRFFADILGCREEQVFVGGNASLTLMYDTVAKAFHTRASAQLFALGKTGRTQIPLPGPGV